MADDISTLIEEAEDIIDQIEGIYEQSLTTHAPERVKAKVKTVVEHYRSALDYLAVAITTAYGKQTKGVVYYPFARDDAMFEREIDQKMPGVRISRQDIADEIRSVQPYNRDWLRTLNKLARHNKHNTLTPQARTEDVRRESGGVSWTPEGVTFGDGVFINGERVDPITQRTPSTREVTYVDWLFEDLQLSVLGTLRTIRSELPQAVAAIRHVAAL